MRGRSGRSSGWLGGRVPGGRLLIGGVLGSLLVGSLGGAAPVFAAAPVVDAPQSASEPVVERPDAVSAQLAAGAQGSRVEVADARSASGRVWANPDGSFTLEAFSGPNWTRTTSGEWVEIDTRLVTGGDGVVRPRAGAVDVQLSGARAGGAGAAVVSVAVPRSALDGLAKARVDAEAPVPVADDAGANPASLTVGFDGALPEPVLVGNEARYPGVAEGRDLRVRVLPGGVETFVDLTEPPAVVPPAGVEISLPVSAKGLVVAEDGRGGLVVTDARTGEVVGSTPRARVWDATVDPVSGLPEHEVVVDTELRKTDAGWLVVATVPAGFLATPGLVFPVTVDPVATLTPSKDTFVEKGYDTTNFGSDPDLRVGSYDGGVHVARSYLQFLMSSAPYLYDPDDDTTVIDTAKLKLWEWWAASCTASDMGIRRLTDTFGESTVTWNTKPTQSGAAYTVADAHRNDSSGECAEGWFDDASGTEVRAIVQGWVNADYTNYGFALTGSETSATSWKRFHSNEYATSARRPSLVVTYHHVPKVPTGLVVANSVAGYVGSTTPQVRATVKDYDGGQVRARAEVWSGTSMVWSGYSGYVASGGVTPWLTLGGMVNGSTYTVKVFANDGSSTSAAPVSTTVTVDQNAPAAPTVTSTFTAGAWAGTDQGTFTFSSTSTDVVAWQWSTDGGTTWGSAGDANGSPGTTPTVRMPGGWVALQARAVDRVGNLSTPTTYSFGVPAVLPPTADGTTLRYLPLAAAGPAAATRVTFQYRTTPAAAWVNIPTSTVKLGQTTIPAWPVATTVAGNQAQAPAGLVWDMPATLAGDATVGVRAVFSVGASATSVNTADARLDSHAYGLAYATTDTPAGPVSLITGNLAVTDADADVASYGGGLGVSRTFNTLDPGLVPVVGPAVFGPGWATSLLSAESDWASAADVGTQVRLTDTDGGLWFFTETATPGAYTPVGDALAAGLTLTGSGSGTTRTLALTDIDGARVDFAPVNPGWVGTPSLGTPDTYRVSGSQQAGITGFSTFEYNADGTPKALIAPRPAGVTCTTTLVDPGCRLLAFTYTDADPGAGVATRLAKVTLKTTTTTGAAVSVDVACYSYDPTAGYRLGTVWDPRVGGSAGWSTTCGSPVQPTTYGYDGSGRVASVTPPGVNPTTITYTGTKVTAVSQVIGGTTLATTIGYDPFPVASGTTSADRPDLSTARVAAWGQVDVPLSAVVVFGPGAAAAGSDLRAGTVVGINAAGRVVNSGVYSGSGQDGWRIDTTEYDAYANPVRSLTAAARDRALNPAAHASELTGLGLTTSTPSARIAAALDTRSLYTPDGADLVDVFGPARLVVLPDGTQAAARPHTRNTYGTVDYPGTNPTDWTVGGPTHAVVSTIEEASLSLAPAVVSPTDQVETRYGYGLSSSDHPGWDLRTPMKVTVENGATDITTTTRFDTNGNVIEQRQPSATGTAHPGTRVSSYYTTGTHNPAACTSTVWYAQLCTTAPGAQPGTSGLPGLPTTAYTYDALLRPTVVTETVTPAGGGSQTRTTTTTYGNAGASPQVSTVAVTGGSGTAVPTTTYGYDTTTGLPTTIGNGTVTLTTGYDTLGRVVSYSEGATSPSVTTTYDTHGRVGTRTWKTTPTTTLATATYTYGDGAGGEYRGVLTKITDTTLPGDITGTYGPGGELARQTLPGTGGITQTFTTDATGDTVSTSWADGSGNLFLGDAQVSDVHGRWAQQTMTGTTPGWDQRAYGYDPAGRLTTVAETREDTTGCTTRTYAFDINSNRTSATTYPDAGAGCTTSSTPTSTQTLSYDSADRLLSSGSATGVAYDAWGRITTLPAGLTATPSAGNPTVGYHVNDLARSTTQGGVTRTWTLDPAQRLATMGTTGAGSTALANHYSDPSSDAPGWTLDTSSGGTATTRRYLESLTGGLTIEAATTGAATTLTAQLVGLHGDILRTTSLTATGSPDGPGIDTDEYGVVRDTTGAPTTGPRHAWLGTHQRPADTGPTGLILMGVRLYATLLGRFLQTDPVYGGNPNTYTYPVDPINAVDLDGKWWGWRKTLRRAATVTGLLAAGACIVATAGACSALTLAAVGASVAWNSYQVRNGTDNGGRLSAGRAGVNVFVDGISMKFRAVRNFRRASVLKVRWRPRLSGGRYGGFYLKSVRPTQSLRWTARNHSRHAATWSAVNAYYGSRSVSNGW